MSVICWLIYCLSGHRVIVWEVRLAWPCSGFCLHCSTTSAREGRKTNRKPQALPRKTLYRANFPLEESRVGLTVRKLAYWADQTRASLLLEAVICFEAAAEGADCLLSVLTAASTLFHLPRSTAGSQDCLKRSVSRSYESLRQHRPSKSNNNNNNDKKSF